MEIRIKELLPIGTVVRLNGAEKSLMIFGIRQTNMETNVEYDYLGVLYPEGNMGVETQVFFNHEAIETVYFKGYEDAEREEFLERLSEFYVSEAE